MKHDFLTANLITCIGNKRRFLMFIEEEIGRIKTTLGKDKIFGKISCLDGFSGSGVVARLFKQHASDLYVNDLEPYSEVINRCYLANSSEVNKAVICDLITYLNHNKLRCSDIGFIERLYAPKDDSDIKPQERCFFTNKNAKIIDNIRRMIGKQEHFALAPLLVKASIHANTSGVFKGFHKKDGVGHFGGKGENALSRITAEISLDPPLFSEQECHTEIFREDINTLVDKLPEVDVAYYDPPYDQHPYGSNYFMLNLITNYIEPNEVSEISGIPKDWNRSNYNKQGEALISLIQLVEKTKAKYVLISYNNEGIIPLDVLQDELKTFGHLEVREKEYNTYRGSRNLKNRDKHVTEYLWVLKK